MSYISETYELLIEAYIKHPDLHPWPDGGLLKRLDDPNCVGITLERKDGKWQIKDVEVTSL